MESAPHLCEMIAHAPDGASIRKWTLREDNNSHHHGVVSITESPLFLELSIRATSKSEPNLVGLFKLDLRGLLKNGYIRYEPACAEGPEVRLRVKKAFNGVIYIQVNDDSPRLMLR